MISLFLSMVFGRTWSYWCWLILIKSDFISIAFRCLSTKLIFQHISKLLIRLRRIYGTIFLGLKVSKGLTGSCSSNKSLRGLSGRWRGSLLKGRFMSKSVLITLHITYYLFFFHLRFQNQDPFRTCAINTCYKFLILLSVEIELVIMTNRIQINDRCSFGNEQ